MTIQPMDYLELTIDFPPNPLYGMGVHVDGLAHALANTGRSVLVATRNRTKSIETSENNDRLRVLRCSAEWDKEHLQPKPQKFSEHFIQGQLAFGHEMLRQIKESSIQCRVVHNHSYATVPLACELSARWRVPLVSTIHVLDISNDRMNVVRPPWIDRHVLRALEAEGLKHSDLIIAPSTTIAEWLVDEFPSCAGRVAVLPHPNPHGIKGKESYQAHQPFRILFVGRLIGYKGITQLLQAIGRLDIEAVECWIVGEGGMRGDLETLASTLGVKTRFLGQLPHDEVLKLYSEVDVLAVPSSVETYGLVLQEGLFAGLPAVATNLEVFKERIIHNENGLLGGFITSDEGTVPDVQDLSRSLRQLIESQELRERLGREAARRAYAVGDFTTYATQLDQLVQNKLYAEA